MNLNYLGISVLVGLGAGLYYFIHKSWLQHVKNNDSFFASDIKFKTIKDWIIIVSLLIVPVVYFFKSIL